MPPRSASGNLLNVKQTPDPGSHLLRHCGETVTFELFLDAPQAGEAWLRTNLGHARIRRAELVRHVEDDEPVLARDWHDIPMFPAGDAHYRLCLPMHEVGVSEAKTFFLPAGGGEPVWPGGDNTVIKVEPAEYRASNTMYAAFVRLFGADGADDPADPARDRAAALLDEAGYTVIPKSGTFRGLIAELDFIIGVLGFRIVQLLPIHPAPTTYARMGRFGSPFAVLDYMAVDPSLAEFDRQTTPLDQFRELVHAVHARDARLFLDVPLNHTGWASRLQLHHPGWFARNADRTFQSPGAWGVTWEDLSRLDYGNRDLWVHMAKVLLYWCRQGVDGFRCDAGYMVPRAVWQYITARVRQEFPDTIFLLEGLGGKAEVVEDLLTTANLDWAYSELFQVYDRDQFASYLPHCTQVSATRGLLTHFAETHDNDRLASRSQVHARMRTAVAALCSRQGAFGITCGVEWFSAHKIDVHGATPLNRGSAENQVQHIARLTAILDTHPAFHDGASARLVQSGGDNTLALLRRPPRDDDAVLVLVNLDGARDGDVAWPRDALPADPDEFTDLLSGRPVTPGRRDGDASLRLGAGETLCLATHPGHLPALDGLISDRGSRRAAVRGHRLIAKAQDVHCHLHGDHTAPHADMAEEARRLAEDPRGFVAACAGGGRPPVVSWRAPRDSRRCVMVPPGDFLCVTAEHPFTVAVEERRWTVRRERSLPVAGGGHFALLLPVETPPAPLRRRLRITVFAPDGSRTEEAPLLYLPRARGAVARASVSRGEARDLDSYALCTNGRGGMAQVHAAWGTLRSRYDALLAGNLHPDHPVDRTVMLTRLRAWLVYRGYSHEINLDCVTRFGVDRVDSASWDMAVPAGLGKLVRLRVALDMHRERNAVRVAFRREPARAHPSDLPADAEITLILRPDVEDRTNHGVVKAYQGAERAWPPAVTPRDDGFTFAPAGARRLRVAASPGRFTSAPEWSYMVPHPEESQRGLDDASDLFSPGYFEIPLPDGGATALEAEIATDLVDEAHDKAHDEDTHANMHHHPGGAAPASVDRETVPLDEALRVAMRQFVVKRGRGRTVIAGYPWFLDWGRDTLICLRGMAAGMSAEARDIVVQFAALEDRGTLPNMIRGADSSDRDTSDAPLWLFVAVADLLAAADGDEFLDTACGDRSLRDVLLSIASHYRDGTPNGIVMDRDSGLVFSPAHFTWMDTNYPAGTPREGYPVEIQALWFAALRLAARAEPGGGWEGLADQVRRSAMDLFAREDDGYLADCLHAPPGRAAAAAAADDALRPNQLLAVTLGLVDHREWRERILLACEELLVPGAIRSLADRPVTHAIPVMHRGRPLNDPDRPYWGRYGGDEDTRRKPAYHNGTAWTWPFPSYAEALYLTYGNPARETALALLSSTIDVLDRGCLLQVPEILDGDAPHAPRGCGAQAWGVTECYRVLTLLNEMEEDRS